MKKRSIILFGMIISMAAMTAHAEILYDGAQTGGVTTDDQYVIDYDTSSIGNVVLQFGASTNYLRFNTVSGNFEISSNLDLGSKQLINARIQNVALVGDVPTCSAASDRGKAIFTGGAIINLVSTQVLAINTQYICNNTNAANAVWVNVSNGDATTLNGLSSTDFLRSNASTTYTGPGNTLTFAAGTNVVFTTTSVALPGTTANSFVVNNDAANGDSSTLTFGDGTGTMIFNDTTGIFTLNNSLTVTGTTTTSNLTVGALGTVNLNNNQVQNLRLENLAVLPGSPAVGRIIQLTANDTTAPGCSVAVPCTPATYSWDGTKWNRTSIDGTSSTLTFSPEYANSTTRPDGLDNIGVMSSDFDATANNNFYRWTTNITSLQDLDVVADVRLPDDFKSFAAANPVQFDIRSSDINAARAKIDLTGSDTVGAALVFSPVATNIIPAVINTWTPRSYGITGGTFTAGSKVRLTFKLSAMKTGGISSTMDLGSLRLNYIRKSP